MTTVSGTNIKEIPDIIDTVVAHKANVFAFARYCPTSDEKDTNMTPQEYKDLLKICDEKFNAYEAARCETFFNKKDHLWTLYEYESGEFTIPDNAREWMIYGGCNCGNCHMTILPNGDIYACRRVQNSRVSNVFKDRLADVWICQMETYREYDKKEYGVQPEAWGPSAEGNRGIFTDKALTLNMPLFKTVKKYKVTMIASQPHKGNCFHCCFFTFCCHRLQQVASNKNMLQQYCYNNIKVGLCRETNLIFFIIYNM